MRVTVLTEELPSCDDFTGTLTGWIVYEGRVTAVVVADGDDFPLLIPHSRIRFR